MDTEIKNAVSAADREAQNDEPESYDILNRAIFYVSRLISSAPMTGKES